MERRGWLRGQWGESELGRARRSTALRDRGARSSQPKTETWRQFSTCIVGDCDGSVMWRWDAPFTRGCGRVALNREAKHKGMRPSRGDAHARTNRTQHGIRRWPARWRWPVRRYEAAGAYLRRHRQKARPAKCASRNGSRSAATRRAVRGAADESGAGVRAGGGADAGAGDRRADGARSALATPRCFGRSHSPRRIG